MKTRQQYIKGECTHREYYSQFVTDRIKELVLKGIGFNAIINGKDDHMNDIPLNLWDSLVPYVHCNFENAGDFRSIAGCVCVLKEAAKQIKEAAK